MNTGLTLLILKVARRALLALAVLPFVEVRTAPYGGLSASRT
ncbi:hypothetical protein SAMN05216215_102880 [Saccharopolyspora shandongensis]|uniref:Uncharacterized protein n=1 Tax=Saccharopolyspora shandongensis TaxID=418495 RepID=A0A1H3KKR0_9PSEU|nr:hypothetical protein SAMN05216215_102880 [Saccharopolyspora shandongensis]